jgi:hypothetical protein
MGSARGSSAFLSYLYPQRRFALFVAASVSVLVLVTCRRSNLLVADLILLLHVRTSGACDVLPGGSA